MLSQFLVSEGFTTAIETNAESAIERLAGNAPDLFVPDLIILDLMLPGMDGVEFCQHIRNEFHNGILLLTAHEGEMQEVTPDEEGINLLFLLQQSVESASDERISTVRSEYIISLQQSVNCQSIEQYCYKCPQVRRSKSIDRNIEVCKIYRNCDF